MIGARESVGIEWRPGELRAVRLERGMRGLRCRQAVTLTGDGGALGERLLSAIGPTSSGPVVLGLPSQHGLIRRLVLPAEDPSLLRQLLEFEVERHLPLSAAKLCFDYVVQGRRDRSQWDLLLVASPRHLVEAAIESLAPAGVGPTRVTLAPVATAAVAVFAGAPSGPGLVVEATPGQLRAEILEAGCPLWTQERPLPESSKHERIVAVAALAEEGRAASPVTWALWLGDGDPEPLVRWSRQVGIPCLDPLGRLRLQGGGDLDPGYTAAVGLALQGLGRGPWRLNLIDPTVPAPRKARWRWPAIAAAVLVFGVGTGLWVRDYQRDRRALARNLAKIQRLTLEVQQVEADARRVADHRRVVESIERAGREPSKLALLGELTEVTPRHTWLTRFTYRRGEVEFTGYSPSTQELIPRLEGSPHFRQASFFGTIEREGDQERFTIRARVR